MADGDRHLHRHRPLHALNTVVSCASFQIVHRALAAMLGSLAALAALAVIGDVSCDIHVKGHLWI